MTLVEGSENNLLLDVKDLKMYFPIERGFFRSKLVGYVRAVDWVTVYIREGETLVLVGESGCGKTTLLHVIAGISRPTEGKVRIDDFDLTLMTEPEVDRFRAERIGYVFQTFNLLSGFTALENVLLAMRFARGRPDKARARRLLDRVGLSHRLTHRPTMLSVGEQQRVAVARALVKRPALILADEPTGQLDTLTGAGIVALLKEIATQTGVTVVVASHDPNVHQAADWIYELKDGQLVGKIRGGDNEENKDQVFRPPQARKAASAPPE